MSKQTYYLEAVDVMWGGMGEHRYDSKGDMVSGPMVVDVIYARRPLSEGFLRCVIVAADDDAKKYKVELIPYSYGEYGRSLIISAYEGPAGVDLCKLVREYRALHPEQFEPHKLDEAWFSDFVSNRFGLVEIAEVRDGNV